MQRALRLLALVFKEFLEEFDCRFFVALISYKYVQLITFLLYRSPQVSEFTINLDEDFIEKPLITK